MTMNRSLWKVVTGLIVVLSSACAEPRDANDDAIEVGSHAQPVVTAFPCPVSDGGVPPPPTHEALIGDVIGNNGYSYRVGSGDRVCFYGSSSWNACAPGYSYLGRYFTASGFWLCARNDLANRTFYVGDVESDFGHYYRVTSSGVTTLASQSWNACADGSTLLGTWFNSNGFWICMK